MKTFSHSEMSIEVILVRPVRCASAKERRMCTCLLCLRVVAVKQRRGREVKTRPVSSSCSIG